MKTVIVASTNPVKMETCQQAFELVFPDEQITIEGRAVASGVSN